MNYKFIPIGIYFLIFCWIGFFSYKKSSSDLGRYMLGGRSMGPALTALSAGASDMSSWLLMGLPGLVYVGGHIQSIWMVTGLILGAYFNYKWVAPRLRIYSQIARDSITLPSFFENRFYVKAKYLRLLSSLFILVFFTMYVSCGILAGGILFEDAFGLNYNLGVVLIAGVVMFYTLLGGFSAVSLTDFIQAIIMIAALLLVPIIAMIELEGEKTIHHIKALNWNLFDKLKGNVYLSILSFLAWGLGYFGQPHIIVRFMAISCVKEIKKARKIGMNWMIFSIFGAILIGFMGIIYVKEKNLVLDNEELIFIRFTSWLFHPLIEGIFLSAILAAIMSTISSQLLVTSSAFTEDFYRRFLSKKASEKQLVFVGRISVFLITSIATFLAYQTDKNILGLVSHAWAGFGGVFGPLVLFSLYFSRMTASGALSGMILGAITFFLWISHSNPYKEVLYEIIPSFIINSVGIILVSLLDKRLHPEANKLFEKMKKQLANSK